MLIKNKLELNFFLEKLFKFLVIKIEKIFNKKFMK
jgi:hypothetical protein